MLAQYLQNLAESMCSFPQFGHHLVRVDGCVSFISPFVVEPHSVQKTPVGSRRAPQSEQNTCENTPDPLRFSSPRRRCSSSFLHFSFNRSRVILYWSLFFFSSSSFFLRYSNSLFFNSSSSFLILLSNSKFFSFSVYSFSIAFFLATKFSAFFILFLR